MLTDGLSDLKVASRFREFITAGHGNIKDRQIAAKIEAHTAAQDFHTKFCIGRLTVPDSAFAHVGAGIILVERYDVVFFHRGKRLHIAVGLAEAADVVRLGRHQKIHRTAFQQFF